MIILFVCVCVFAPPPAHCCHSSPAPSQTTTKTKTHKTKVRTSSDLYRVLDKSSVGDALDIQLLRGNDEVHVSALLEANA